MMPCAQRSNSCARPTVSDFIYMHDADWLKRRVLDLQKENVRQQMDIELNRFALWLFGLLFGIHWWVCR